MTPLVTSSFVMLAALASSFGSDEHRYSPPPKPYDDKVLLPGEIPPSASRVGGAWHYAYVLSGAQLEAGKSDLYVSIALTLVEDGSYELRYVARWNLPRPKIPVFIPNPLPIPLPKSSSTGADGIDVTETGRFALSGQILLLEPLQTRHANVDNNRVVNESVIANEKHVLIVRRDPTHIAVAGRCANWQIDPVCKTTATIWYVMRHLGQPR